MELHQLRYAIAVVDHGSFTAAAEHLRIAQSGVSNQVAKLERELGVTLLDRSARRVVPTPEGRRLLPAMRAALETVDAVARVADELRGLVIGEVRLGTVRGLTWPPLIDAIAELDERHPGVEIRLVEADSAELVARIRDGGLDVAIAAWSGRTPDGAAGYPLIDDAIVAVVVPGHAWADLGRVRTEELVRSPLICLPRGTGARDALDAAARRAGVAAEPRWEVSTPAVAETLVVRGLGVAVVSESTAADWSGVVVVPLDDTSTRSTLGVLHRPVPSPASAALLAALR